MKLRLIPLLFGLCAASAAHAEVLLFEYTATVTEALNDRARPGDPEGAAFNNTVIHKANTLTGWFQVDLDTPWRQANRDSHGVSGWFSHYSPDDATTNEAWFRVDQTNYMARPAHREQTQFWLNDSVPGDRYGDSLEVRAGGKLYDEKYLYSLQNFTLDFEQNDGQLFAPTAPGNLALPKTIDFSGLDKATLRFSHLDYVSTPSGTSLAEYYRITAQLTSLKLVTSPVPEPSTYLMLGVGLLGVAGAAWRQKQRAG